MQTDFVINDREMIIQAVLDGLLGCEHISLDEIQELEENLFEEICDIHTPFSIS